MKVEINRESLSNILEQKSVSVIARGFITPETEDRIRAKFEEVFGKNCNWDSLKKEIFETAEVNATMPKTYGFTVVSSGVTNIEIGLDEIDLEVVCK